MNESLKRMQQLTKEVNQIIKNQKKLDLLCIIITNDLGIQLAQNSEKIWIDADFSQKLIAFVIKQKYWNYINYTF